MVKGKDGTVSLVSKGKRGSVHDVKGKGNINNEADRGYLTASGVASSYDEVRGPI